MWDALADIADEHGKTVYDLIAEIHRNHSQANLSSAIRVYIVEHYRAALHKARNARDTAPKVAPDERRVRIEASVGLKSHVFTDNVNALITRGP
jgi:predicted DNA-binding ribbon-helix-helix protein